MQLTTFGDVEPLNFIQFFNAISFVPSEYMILPDFMKYASNFETLSIDIPNSNAICFLLIS